MNTLGIQLQLMIGPTIPLPVPRQVANALQNVEVTHSDAGRSGFELQFRVNTAGVGGALSSIVLSNPLFKTFNRVVLTVIFKGMPHVVMDGIVTHQQLQPSGQPGVSTFTLTGEDVSVMMDQTNKPAQHPGQPEMVIATKIILSYAQYGLIPLVIPPASLDIPLPTDRIPVQQETDLQYLYELAERFAYVFYVTPGPAPLTNTAYWGPPIRIGIPQKALSVNMGAHSNVDSIDFQHDAQAPTMVEGKVKDPITNKTLPIRTFLSMRLPLSSLPDWAVNQPYVRTTTLRESGKNIAQGLTKAQSITDKSNDDVVTATGELDAMRYGDLLKPRSLVGVRGASVLYDGLYYVRKVTHVIKKGSYRQRFTLARDGLGTTTPVVRV